MLTVANLVARFSNKYDFFIFTRNHDGINDRTPYTEVITGEWNDLGTPKILSRSGED